jgi:hypothetical protein
MSYAGARDVIVDVLELVEDAENSVSYLSTAVSRFRPDGSAFRRSIG